MLNLDALDILDLEEFVTEHSDITLLKAREYFNIDKHKKHIENADVLRAMHFHVAYAVLRLAWYDDIANGKPENADATEEILETLIYKMPKFARW